MKSNHLGTKSKLNTLHEMIIYFLVSFLWFLGNQTHLTKTNSVTKRIPVEGKLKCSWEFMRELTPETHFFGYTRLRELC